MQYLKLKLILVICPYGYLIVDEDCSHSHINYGTGLLVANECYADDIHISSFESVVIDTDGCYNNQYKKVIFSVCFRQTNSR